VLEYLGGGLCLALFGSPGATRLHAPGLQRFSLIGAVVVFIAFVAMLHPQLSSVRGIFQRIAEFALFSWVGVVSWQLWARERGRS